MGDMCSPATCHTTVQMSMVQRTEVKGPYLTHSGANVFLARAIAAAQALNAGTQQELDSICSKALTCCTKRPWPGPSPDLPGYTAVPQACGFGSCKAGTTLRNERRQLLTTFSASSEEVSFKGFSPVKRLQLCSFRPTSRRPPFRLGSRIRLPCRPRRRPRIVSGRRTLVTNLYAPNVCPRLPCG